MKRTTLPSHIYKDLLKGALLVVFSIGIFIPKVEADPGEPYCSYEALFKSLAKNKQMDSAFAVIQEAIQLCKKRGDSIALAYFYTSKANLMNDLHQKQAFHYFFEARKILEPRGPSENLAILYHSMATSHGMMYKKAQQKDLLQRALKISKDLHFPRKVAHFYNLLASYHVCNNDSVRYYTNKSLRISTELNDKTRQGYSYILLGLINRENGYLDSALYYFKKGLQVSPPLAEYQKITARYNIMDIFFRENMHDSAFFYYNSFKDMLSEYPMRAKETYKDLIIHYRNQGNYPKAFWYEAKKDSVQTHLIKKQDNNAYEIATMEHKAQLKQAKLEKTEAQAKKAEQERLFLILLLGGGLIFAGVTFYQIKQKNRKKREALLQKKDKLETQQKLADSELKNSKLQNQQLAERLKYSNNELASFAARTVKNKEILNEVKDRVTQALRKREPQKIKDVLKELHVMLLQMLHKDEDQRQKIVERAENINSELFYSLRMRFPRLSDNDLNLMVLLLLKFSSKEIASIYQIEEDSVVRRRYRLRKRLNIAKHESFESFFHRILDDEDLIRHAKVSGADYSSNEGTSSENILKKT